MRRYISGTWGCWGSELRSSGFHKSFTNWAISLRRFYPFFPKVYYNFLYLSHFILSSLPFLSFLSFPFISFLDMASCSQSWPWDLYVAEDNPELLIFLLLLCEFWDYRGTLPHYLVYVLLGIEPKFHACQAGSLLSSISSSLWNFTVNKNIWMLRKIMFFFFLRNTVVPPPHPHLPYTPTQ